jgi:hypothetical protein
MAENTLDLKHALTIFASTRKEQKSMSIRQGPGLFQEKKEYSGILTARPNIPPGEIWVFSQWNGENIVATREDNEYILPPPPPWLKRRATQVYRFRRQTDYETTQSYLSLTQYPTTIRWHVTLKLRDPLAFMDSSFEIDNFPKIQADLIAALIPSVEGILMEQMNTVIVSNPYDITPPPLQQVLSRRRFDDYVRGEFRSMGLELQVVAMDIQCPAYQALMSRAALEPQNTLIDGRNSVIKSAVNLGIEKQRFDFGEQKKMIAATNDLQIALQRLDYDIKYIQSVVGQVREINPQYLALVQNAITQIGNTPNPQAVTILLNQLLSLAPHPMQSPSTSIGTGTSPANKRGTAQPALSGGSVREQHIQALYQTAQEAGWQISPPLNSIDDFIHIDLSNMREVELRIPSTYPIAKALVSRAKSQGMRISQSLVNQLTQSVINGPYDLVILVQQLDKNIQ